MPLVPEVLQLEWAGSCCSGSEIQSAGVRDACRVRCMFACCTISRAALIAA